MINKQFYQHTLGWLAGFKYRRPYLVYLCMFGVVCLGAAGFFLDVTYWLIIAGLSFALAAWDILLFRISLSNTQSKTIHGVFEKKHLRALAIAIGIGLVITIPLHSINIRLPFFIILLLIVLAGLGIERLWIFLRKHQVRVP